MTIDREFLADTIWGGSMLPAYVLVPPGVPGINPIEPDFAALAPIEAETQGAEAFARGGLRAGRQAARRRDPLQFERDPPSHGDRDRRHVAPARGDGEFSQHRRQDAFRLSARRRRFRRRPRRLARRLRRRAEFSRTGGERQSRAQLLALVEPGLRCAARARRRRARHNQARRSADAGGSDPQPRATDRAADVSGVEEPRVEQGAGLAGQTRSTATSPAICRSRPDRPLSAARRRTAANIPH